MSQEIDNKTQSTSVLQLKNFIYCNVSKIQINTASAKWVCNALHI